MNHIGFLKPRYSIQRPLVSWARVPAKKKEKFKRAASNSKETSIKESTWDNSVTEGPHQIIGLKFQFLIYCGTTLQRLDNNREKNWHRCESCLGKTPQVFVGLLIFPIKFFVQFVIYLGIVFTYSFCLIVFLFPLCRPSRNSKQAIMTWNIH